MTGFRLVSATQGGRRFQLSRDAAPQSASNHFTVLIGKNGSGKSRFLADLCRSFATMDEELHSSAEKLKFRKLRPGFDVTYVISGRKVSVTRERGPVFFDGADWHRAAKPARVIATTITPFDKFPVSRGRSDFSAEHAMYRYLGAKNRVGQATGSGQLSRVVESLIFATHKLAADRVRLSQVFDLLGYKPRIEIVYRPRFSKKTLEELGTTSGGQPGELLNVLLRNSPFRHRFDREGGVDPQRSRQLHVAVEKLAARIERGRLTFEVDFESGYRTPDLFELYEDISELRSYGLISLSGLMLERRDDNTQIDLKEASSGEQSIAVTILGIAGEIKDNSLVIIDEPEISLHPEWQEAFIPLLSSTFSSYAGCHFLLATHSPLLLSRLDPNNTSVFLMDSDSLVGAEQFSQRSSDYQLATAFETPGYRNEYLMREGLLALSLAAQGKTGTHEFVSRRLLLQNSKAHLEQDDPVYAIAEAIENAYSEAKP